MSQARASDAQRWIVSAALGAMAVALVFVVMRLTAPDTQGPAVQIGGPFELVDHTGRTVTNEDFLGRPMLVYFGFTYCPDVCPMSLQALARALDELGEDAEVFQPILISVDPERDTPELLAAYVASNGFPDNLVGLTGEPEAVRAAASAYRADYRRIEDDTFADYLIEHTSVIYLMDENGVFVEPFTHASTPDDMAASLRRYLNDHPRIGRGS